MNEENHKSRIGPPVISRPDLDKLQRQQDVIALHEEELGMLKACHGQLYRSIAHRYNLPEQFVIDTETGEVTVPHG